MPQNTVRNDATLRQKVLRIATAPLSDIDAVIRSLDPAHDSQGVAEERKIESALAELAGEIEEAPISSDPRDAAARRIQNAFRLSRISSRSRALIGEILAQIVALEIGHKGGKPLIATHTKERTRHIKTIDTMLGILIEHGMYTKAANMADLIEKVLKLDLSTRKKLLPRMTENQYWALTRGLVYLSNSARASYRLAFDNGKLMWRGAPLDTAGMHSAWSSEGRAIYVLDKQGRFYAAAQNLSDSANERFHHSSFLSGAPVFGAGEMQVHEGTLEVLTAQSGHYQPTHNEMTQTVRELMGHGIRFFRVALWSEEEEAAAQLRKKFAKAQVIYRAVPGDMGYRRKDEPVSEEDTPWLPDVPEGDWRLVYVPAHEYLFNPSLRQSLLLYRPKRKQKPLF